MKNLHLIFISGIITFLTSFVFSQNPYAILAPMSYNLALGPVPIPLPTNWTGSASEGFYPNQAAEFSQNIQVDPQGRILFFIVDGKVYARNGAMLAKMQFGPYNGQTGLNDCSGSIALGTSEVDIVPVPGECHEYYIISTIPNFSLVSNNTAGASGFAIYGKIRVEYNSNDQLLASSGVYKYNNGALNFEPFFQLDQNGNPGFMEPICSWMAPFIEFNTSQSTVIQQNLGPIQFAVTERNSSGKRFVFLAGTRELWRYELSSAGISNGAIVMDYIATLPQPGLQNLPQSRSEMEVVTLDNGNYRLAYRFERSGPSVIIMDVSSSGNLIPNSYKFQTYPIFPNSAGNNTSVAISGLEFSPSGEKLYVTHTTNNPNFPQPIDILDVSGSTVTRTPLSLPGMIDFQHSQIEIGKDVNGFSLYMVTHNRRAKIKNPDASWNNSNWVNLDLNFAASGFSYSLSQSASFQAANDIYLLSSQLDQDDYNAHFTQNPSCCVIFKDYDKVRFTASANGTWIAGTNGNPVATSASNTVFIKEELRIPAGRTITIRNMIFKFAPGARVIIENGVNGGQGGRLILDGTVFTNDTDCENKMWQGVEVWGNTNTTQLSPSQGALTMFNNARIENAEVGVLLSRRRFPSSLSLDVARSGGIVRCSNSTLKNNARGVFMNTYLPSNNANNQSFFTNVRFEWTVLDRPTNLRPFDHAYLNRVRGVNFAGCDFILEAGLMNNFRTTTGINANESSFTVNTRCNSIIALGQPCPSIDPSVFTNLNHGVLSRNLNSALTYSVMNTDFNNCRYGIYNLGTDNQRVTNNRFAVREDANLQTVGLAMYFSKGYIVQENFFAEQDNSSVTNGTGNSYGIVVNNSDSLPNQIYKNTFTNLRIGGQSEAKNGAILWNTNAPRGGLQWICNTFKADIYQADLGLTAFASIDYEQGFPNATSLANAQLSSARNEFSMFGGFADNDLLSHPDAYQYTYVYLSTPLQQPDVFTVNKVLPLAQTFNNIPVTNTTNVCPSRLGRTRIAILSELDGFNGEIVLLDEQINTATADELPALLSERNYLKSQYEDARAFLRHEYLMDSTNGGDYGAYVGFLNDISDDLAKRDLLYHNIAVNEMDNNDQLRSELSPVLSAEELEITLILEELRNVEDVNEYFASNGDLMNRVYNIINSTSDPIVAGQAILLLPVDLDAELFFPDFLPLGFESKPQKVEENELPNRYLGVRIYPNPSNGEVNFATSDAENQFTKVELYDLSGKVVATENFESTDQKTLNFQHLNGGMYIVKIYNGNNTTETKLLKLQ